MKFFHEKSDNDFEYINSENGLWSVRKVWEASVHTGFSSMSIAGGRLFTMGNQNDQDIITCLDLADGNEVWNFRYACKLEPNLYQGGPSATPTVHEDRVYTLSKFGDIFCLDAVTGEKVWAASAASYRPATKRWWGFAGSPTVIGDVVIYNVGSRGMALHKDTGKKVWSSDEGTIGYCTIVPLPEDLLNRPAIVVLTNEAIHVLDPVNGQYVVEVESPFKRKANCNAITPVVWDGALYVTHSELGMSRLALSENSFRSQWLQRKPAMSWHTFNHRVYHDNHIYFLNKKGLCCLDADSGDVVWEEEGFGFGNLLVVGDSLVMLAEDGVLVWGVLKEGRFQETARQKILEERCWAYPVIADGRLYARNAAGNLVCIEFE